MSIDSEDLRRAKKGLVDAVERMSEAGEKWANAKAKYENIKDQEKSFLASLMPDSGSQAFKEQQALKHQDWKIFCEGLAHAREAFLKAQANYECLKIRVEAYRSIFSAMKEEVKQLRG